MIFDKIANWYTYFPEDKFDLVFKYIENIDCNTADGIYQINDDFYVKVMSYKTLQDPNVIESHRKEVDIQIVLDGRERIKIFNKSDVEIKAEYRDDIDCVFYENPGTARLDLRLGEGYMAVFFPDDIHQPAFTIGESDNFIKKIVIKANANLFS
jgi:biofilm protein TabA